MRDQSSKTISWAPLRIHDTSTGHLLKVFLLLYRVGLVNVRLRNKSLDVTLKEQAITNEWKVVACCNHPLFCEFQSLCPSKCFFAFYSTCHKSPLLMIRDQWEDWQSWLTHSQTWYRSWLTFNFLRHWFFFMCGRVKSATSATTFPHRDSRDGKPYFSSDKKKSVSALYQLFVRPVSVISVFSIYILLGRDCLIQKDFHWDQQQSKFHSLDQQH